MASSPWTLVKEHRSFRGSVRYLEHPSFETKTAMRLSMFVPEGTVQGCIIWLSGLTCTEENFMVKAGALGVAEAHNMLIVCPDTSPRGLDIPKVRENWDFGEGAGFYLDALTPGYADHFRMYSYVTRELYQQITTVFGLAGKISISGHSMGGHGALIIGLRNPDLFCSISAFAPLVNPTACAWGQKAFSGYLGPTNTAAWNQYDACELLRSGHLHPQSILVDQGLEDSFLRDQLHTESFRREALRAGQPAEVRLHEGYDHSYYFVSTFIASHIAFHAKAILGS
jgi:S-formylglutathione hydrolase